MSLTPRLALGFWNAWLLCLPMVLVGLLVTAPRKDVAKRLSDMTGYAGNEKLFTVAASLLPYPFIGLATFTPLASMGALLVAGTLLSAMGTAGFWCTLQVFAKTRADQTLETGPYRLSRNPLYVSATLIFLGVCLATGSLLLSGILVLLFVLQHLMILAEERACRAKYGDPYVAYARRTPRYLGWV
jgi:protein-S-isoprenylcysteine O-methyltransferase Ste14